MIVRVLSRYADARTRRERDNYRALALALAARLKESRAELASERARASAALAHDPMPGFPCDNPACPCQAAAADAIDAAERARTQETHQ